MFFLKKKKREEEEEEEVAYFSSLLPYTISEACSKSHYCCTHTFRFPPYCYY
jgi:hypothetical protein